jgi:RHS repeat-associated protein
VGNESGWVESASTTVDAVTKYYHHGGARVAMRQGGEVYYLHGDHLGSTSLTTDDQGSVVHEARYLPFGEERWVDGEGVTDFTFTGQRNEAGFGLLDYNARYYSSYLNRFVSPDSIIPNLTDPQSLNRYSYVYNNPVRHRDGSGHCVDGLTTVACLIAIGVVAAEAFVVGVLLVDRFPMEVEMAQKTGETVGELVGNVEVYPLPVEDELGLLNLGSRPDAGDYPQVPITSPPFVLESPELGAARDHGLEIVPYDTARGERRGRLPNQQRRQPGGPSSIPESVSKNNPSSLHRGPQAGGTFYDPRQTPPTLNSGDAIDVLLKEITDPTKPLSYRVALIPLLAATAAKRVVDPTLNANEEMSNMNNP